MEEITLCLWTMFQTVLEKWVSIWMLQARG